MSVPLTCGKAVIDFGRAAEGSDMAVVFYAGHGIEMGGENRRTLNCAATRTWKTKPSACQDVPVERLPEPIELYAA
jgi:hypothetical protein